MKLSVSTCTVLLLAQCTVDAFAPSIPMARHHGHATTAFSSTSRLFMAQQHADISSMIHTFTSMTMADAAASEQESNTISGLMDQLMDATTTAAAAAASDAAAAAAAATATVQAKAVDSGVSGLLMDTAAPAAVQAAAVATQTADPVVAAADNGWFGFLSAPAGVDPSAAATAISSAVATQTPDEAAAAAAAAAAADNGWFGFLTAPIAVLIQIIHGLLVSMGLDSNAWGISIILLTLLIKVVTFPLTKTQLESTSKMQDMQPAIKEIQAKYQSNPEVMNQKMADFYKDNEINPLAGCLPSLVQIPVFIGLYRAVLQLASANELDEPFLFLPNLEGPTYGADPAHGSDWLFGEWVNNAPPLGWDDTLAFLILPVFLVISQFVSMELMQPKTQDPAQAQTNVILKVLPIMIGWFALNVPAALSVYWVVNNIVTTGTSVLIRNTRKVEPIKTGGGVGGAAAAVRPPTTIFAPPPQKPSGFGTSASSTNAPKIPRDAVRPITAIDAEIVPKPAPTPPKPAPTPAPAAAEAATDDYDDNAVSEITADSSDPSAPKKYRGKSGKKRKNN